MLGYDSIDDNPKVASKNDCLWRFMIDKNYQKKGFGKQAMSLVIDYVKNASRKS